MDLRRSVLIDLLALGCVVLGACGDSGGAGAETTETGAPATGGSDEGSTGEPVPTTGGETTGDAMTGDATTGEATTGDATTVDPTTGSTSEPLPEGPGLHCVTPGTGIAEPGPEGPFLVTTIALGGDGQVADLNVQARITGTDWTEYLVLRLTHGDVKITLLADACEFNKDLDVTLDDDGAPPACCGDIFCSGDPLIGVFTPNEPLAAFAGAPIAGEWTLEIVAPTWDPNMRNQGVLESFCVDVAAS